MVYQLWSSTRIQVCPLKPVFLHYIEREKRDFKCVYTAAPAAFKNNQNKEQTSYRIVATFYTVICWNLLDDPFLPFTVPI